MHMIRSLDAIKVEIILLRGDVTRQAAQVDGAVSVRDLRAYLREARAQGFENLPPFLTEGRI